MIDADRVVGRLRQLVQDAYAAAGHGSGCEHGGAEVFFADGLRTRECEEDAAGLDFLESLDVQFAVALQGIAQSIAVLGKSRRVKNYQVVLVAHAVKVFEGIFCIGDMAGVTREVQFDVLVGQVDGFGGAVHGMYQFGVSTHSIYGEAAGIAEHIQYAAAFGITFQ